MVKRRTDYDMPMYTDAFRLRQLLGVGGRIEGVDTPESRDAGRRYSHLMQEIVDWLVRYRDTNDGTVINSRTGATQEAWDALLDHLVRRDPSFFSAAATAGLRMAHDTPEEEETWRTYYNALDWLVEQKVKNWGNKEGKRELPINVVPDGSGSTRVHDVEAKDLNLWLKYKEQDERAIGMHPQYSVPCSQQILTCNSRQRPARPTSCHSAGSKVGRRHELPPRRPLARLPVPYQSERFDSSRLRPPRRLVPARRSHH
jgi:hypothetical protein